MRTLTVAKAEISTDGQKVWVNGRTCLARICKVSMEVFPDAVFFDANLAYERTQPGTWERFRAAVLLHHGIDIPFDFIPVWASPVIPG